MKINSIPVTVRPSRYRLSKDITVKISKYPSHETLSILSTAFRDLSAIALSTVT